MQQHLVAFGREAPGRQNRLAPLPRPDPLGNPVHEEVGDVVLRQVAARELLVIGPQPLAQLRDRRPGEQKSARLVLEGSDDVAHREPAR